MAAAPLDAAQAKLLGCECCGLVSAAPPGAPTDPADAATRLRCPRCQHPLHVRRPHSLQMTWAYIAASLLLYIPANALPIMTLSNLFEHNSFTIAGGIAELWRDKAYGLAVIVFIASLAVPLLKIAALALLAWTVRYAPTWRRIERAKLFRIVEAVGHWSMLDVYVVVLLAGMVRFGRLADVQPEPGLLAFTTVVILTMLAARSFDPRMIWQDAPDDD
jgi:paraquat-inducible protein A